jgi:hypothetical protein
VLARIADARGNPFFAVEIARVLGQSRAIRKVTGRYLCRQREELARDRVDGLSALRRGCARCRVVETDDRDGRRGATERERSASGCSRSRNSQVLPTERDRGASPILLASAVY